MDKMIKVLTLLPVSLASVTTFAHSGHDNNIIFHTHNGADHFSVILIIGLLLGVASYYVYKKNIQK